MTGSDTRDETEINMAATVHDLKTWPAYFRQVDLGEKTFEVRKNDRDFQTGDVLRLREYDPARGRYTGRSMVFRVGFVYAGEVGGVAPGFVVMALRPLLSEAAS